SAKHATTAHCRHGRAPRSPPLPVGERSICEANRVRAFDERETVTPHPALCADLSLRERWQLAAVGKAWMPGSSPGMTGGEIRAVKTPSQLSIKLRTWPALSDTHNRRSFHSRNNQPRDPCPFARSSDCSS